MKVTLKALRTNFGLSQIKEAKLLGVSTNTIYGWENGASEPNNKLVKRILNLFNVDYDDLLFCPHLSLKDAKRDDKK